MPERPHTSSSLEKLSDALVTSARDGGIGIPRFIRWLDRVDGGGSIEDSIAAGIEVCSRLFGAPPTREYRTGDGRLQTTVQAVWANGASALVSVGPAGGRSNSGPDVMLLGSSGAVYFDGALGGRTTSDSRGNR
jgi:hypothetical protein